MRPTTPRLLAALGLTLATPGATADDQMYLPSYHIGSAPMPPVPGMNPGPAVGAPAPAPGPAPSQASAPAPAPGASAGRPQAAARPRSSWPRLAPGSRVPEVHAPAPKARPAILTRPSSRPPVAPDGPTAGPTVASELSIAASAPDYVPPSSRGVIARMTQGPEPEVPPGLPRGTPPVAMVPPEPLGRASGEALAGSQPARRPVDPLLAPVTTSLDAGRSTRDSGAAELERAELEARIPRRSEDPLLAPRPLVMASSPAPGPAAPPATVDPSAPARLRDDEPAPAPTPTPTRRRSIPPLIARPGDGPA